MVGRRLLSGKEHEIRFKVCILLCNNIVPETDKLKRGPTSESHRNCPAWGYHQGLLLMFGESTTEIFLIRLIRIFTWW